MFSVLWRQGTHYCLHLVQLYFIDVFELCAMFCRHVSQDFTHVKLPFPAFFENVECNEYHPIQMLIV